jgi:hypothetical protein
MVIDKAPLKPRKTSRNRSGKEKAAQAGRLKSGYIAAGSGASIVVGFAAYAAWLWRRR